MRASGNHILANLRAQPLRYGLCALLFFVLAFELHVEVARSPRHLPPSWSKDARYLRHAESLRAGDWLGDFDADTLEEMPGYALFLARCADLAIAERTALVLLRVLASGFFLLLLLRLRLAPELALLAAALALMTPATLGQIGQRLVPERLHAELAFLAITGLLQMAITRVAWRAVLAAIVTGLVLAIDSLTTPTPLLLAGFVLGALALRAFRDRQEPGPGLGIVPLQLLLVAALLAPGFVVRHQVKALNEEHYGLAVLRDFDEPAYDAALGALERVARAQPSGRLDRNVRAELYRHSPAFARLRPAFESTLYSGPRDGEDMSGRVAALRRETAREGASRSGAFASAASAIAFWETLASEVNGAVDQGLVDGLDEVLDSDRVSFSMPRLGLTWQRLREVWNLEFEDQLPGDPLPRTETDAAGLAAAESILGRFPRDDDFESSADRRWRLLDLARRVLPTLFILAAVGSLMTFLQEQRRSWLLRHYVEFLLFFGSAVILLALCHRELHWLIDRGRGFLLLHFLGPVYLALGLQHHLSAVEKQLGAVERRRVLIAGQVLLVLAVIVMITLPGFIAEDRHGGRLIQSRPDHLVVLHEGKTRARQEKGVPLLEHDGAHLQVRLRNDARHASPQALELRAEVPDVDFGTPFEIRWTGSMRDERGENERRLFAVPGLNTWKLDLSRGNLGDLEIRATEERALAFDFRAVELGPLGRSFETGPDALPEVGFFWRDGEFRIEVTGGEKSSRYEFYFSTERSPEARIYPERRGELWLSAEGGLHEQDGSDYKVVILTDETGSGFATRPFEARESFSTKLLTQGLGTRHFTARPVPMVIVD